jgi:hypothetical protein
MGDRIESSARSAPGDGQISVTASTRCANGGDCRGKNESLLRAGCAALSDHQQARSSPQNYLGNCRRYVGLYAEADASKHVGLF